MIASEIQRLADVFVNMNVESFIWHDFKSRLRCCIGGSVSGAKEFDLFHFSLRTLVKVIIENIHGSHKLSS